VRAEPSRWPGADPATGVPGVERVGGRAHGPDDVVRVEQVRVVPLRAVEVLAQQRQPQVAGKAAGAVAEPGRVAWLPVVPRVVQDRARQLPVVAPGAAVQVGSG